MVKTPIAPLVDKYLELKGAVYLSEKITDQWHTQKDIADEMHVLNGQRNIYSIVFDKLVPNKGFLTCTDASNTNGHDIYEINYDSYNDYWYLGYKIDMNSMSGAGSINSGANDRVFSIANDGKTLALFTNKSDSQKQVYDIYLIDRVYLPQ
jgi:Tol biopolymer transport system component